MNSVLFNGKPITPSKIVCVGRNFAAHAAELGNAVPDDMVLFLKPNSAIGQTLPAQWGVEALHYETEICFLVQSSGYAGVAVGLDLTRRELQSELKKKSLPWERAKAFQGSAVFSPFVGLNVATSTLQLQLDVDGEPRQQGSVNQMLYTPDEVLRAVQNNFSLEDGDIIMTGTPAGVGALEAGRTYSAQVSSNNNVLVSASWQAE